jgi:hypothetical protein
MIISSGANYDDFEAVVDELDSTLTLDAVFYVSDTSNVQQAWAIINSDNGGTIVVKSRVFSDPPSNATFTTDFASAIALTNGLEIG